MFYTIEETVEALKSGKTTSEDLVRSSIDTFEKDKKSEKENKTENKVEKLQEDLKVAIKEERYEDAAKIRDEIKKMSK